MKQIYLLIALSCLFLMAQAQDNLSIPAPQNSNKLIQIDLSGGVNFDLTHRVKSNVVTMLSDRKSTIPTMDMRLLHFFSKHWGWYFDLKLKMNGDEIRDCQAEVCRPFETNYYIKNYARDIDSYSKVTTTVDFGATYRIENTHWAFYPKIGIGFNSMNRQDISARLKGKGTNELYNIYTSNYLDYQSLVTIVELSLGMSINYKVSTRCYLFADINYMQPLQNTKIGYVETNSYSKEVRKHHIFGSTTLGRELNFSAGIGFPIFLHKSVKRPKKPQKERMKDIMEYKRKAFGLFPGNK